MNLDATLDVDADGTVVFTFRVTNRGEQPAELTFRSGRDGDVAVSRDGEEVWRWSDGRMFTQQIRHETLSPGDETTAEGRWSDPPAGRYTVGATLTDADERPTAETTFEV